MNIKAVLLNTTLLAGLVLFGCGKKSDADDPALNQLKRAGVDISKPHKLQFKLRFQAQPAANQAADSLKGAGYEVELKPDPRSGGALCVASKSIVPEPAAIEKTRAELESVAKPLNGTYGGWEIAPEK